jgi:hypothetical protein
MIWRLWFFRPSCFGGRGQERASDIPRFVRDEHGWEGTRKRDLATESLRKRRAGLTRARVREKALPIAIARCAADLRVRKTSWRAKRRGIRHRDCLPASTRSRRIASISCGALIDRQSPQALATRDRSSTPARCRRSRLRAAARRLRRVAHGRARRWSGLRRGRVQVAPRPRAAEHRYHDRPRPEVRGARRRATSTIDNRLVMRSSRQIARARFDLPNRASPGY